MNKYQFVKPERISLKTHSDLNEKWVQERIAEDPSLLGLGQLVLKDKERMQPHAGRLDLLLQDPDSNRRYEVELQLGRTDESHIIRTIEYWDIERKRYPQYDHCAVIVAEDITARFLNVVSLFNGMIPLIAVQMSALCIGEQIALHFTTVMSELELGLEGDDEVDEVTDRTYWENRGSKATVAIVDQVLQLLQEIDPGLELKYNKIYIGLAKGGLVNNFVNFRAKKSFVSLAPRIKQSDEMTKRLDESGLDLMDYDSRWGRYRIRLTADDLKNHRDLIRDVLKQAYQQAGE
jgi:hypothetical protein